MKIKGREAADKHPDEIGPITHSRVPKPVRDSIPGCGNEPLSFEVDKPQGDGWQPIETAPKDGTRIMLFCSGKYGAVFGHWNKDQYSKKPRPYWTNDKEQLWGVYDTRANQPTHWKPLPKPPKE